MSEVQTEINVAQQLKKISDHLVFLEKKIDQLLETRNSQPKPFGQNRYGQNRTVFPSRYAQGSGQQRSSYAGGNAGHAGNGGSKFQGRNNHSHRPSRHA